MGDTASDHDTFVSIENLICTPQPIPFQTDEQTLDLQPSGENPHSNEGDHICDNPQEKGSTGASASPRISSASPQQDHSTFMWNLYAPEGGDVTGGTEECEDTLEVSREFEETLDPSDICGEFNTTSFKKSFVRVQKRSDLITDKKIDSEQIVYADSIENPRETRQMSACATRLQGNIVQVQAMVPSVDSLNAKHSPQPYSIPRRQTEEVLHNATNGVASYMVENPFQSLAEDSSTHSAVILYTSMGSFTEIERHLWDSLAQEPNAPHASVLRRFVETVQFLRKQVQDLKAAEIQMASATLQSERRRHSEVEHERSAAIETLMEQLNEECEQRTYVEEENTNLRTALTELRNHNEEVLDYFLKRDKDFTFSVGIAKALDSFNGRLDSDRQGDEETIQDMKEKLHQTEARMIEMRMIAERRSELCADLESRNQKLRTELLSFNDGNQEQSSNGAAVAQENHISERNALLRELRDMEAEVQKVNSSLKLSRFEQSRVNDAILSMNVELEDSKRRCTALQMQRDSAERRLRDLMRSSTSDRERFYKFQSEMSANFASAVNEVESRKTDIYRLQKELDDREKAFQLQAATVTHLQEQLLSITEAAVENSTRDSRKGGSMEKDQSLSAMVVKSLQEEVSQASTLLKERGEEIEALRQQMYSREELLSSVQVECAKLRTAASVRRITSRMSLGPSVPTEQQESTFLRRLSEKLGSCEADDMQVLKRLSTRIDILSDEKRKFDGIKESLFEEIKQRETALHALRAEMAAEIATLKADVRHQEKLRFRAQDDCKALESKVRELLVTRKVSNRESLGDITSSSYSIREWSIAEESETSSRRESSFSTVRGEDGLRWKDPIIEDAIRCLNALIGRKDELCTRNRELREKLDSLLRNMGLSNEDGERIRSLLLQSKDFQDELTKIVGMQQDILGSIAGSGNEDLPTAVDDTLPYLRQELSPVQKKTEAPCMHTGPTNPTLETLIDEARSKEVDYNSEPKRGEAAQFLRQQLNETRALCNEKLTVNVQLCGVVNELKQELKHLSASNSELKSALSALKGTHEGFVSRLAILTGTEQSVVAIEDSVRTVMHKVADLNHQHATQKEQESTLVKKVTCLVGQKRVLAHIIDLYQSKYKLDILAPIVEKESPRQRFKRCVISIVALQKLSRASSSENNGASGTFTEHGQYELPALAAIGRRRTGTTNLRSALVAIEAMPRLERAVVEKNAEVATLKESIKALERALSVAVVPATALSHEFPTSFVYKEDIMNRKNDMARRLRDVITEKEELDERLSKEKQARIAAEARSSRYFDKISILKKKLGKTVSHAECKERTYKAAIIYLKGKAEKANDDGGWLDENIAPLPSSSPGVVRDPKDTRVEYDDSKAILEQELENAEIELGNLEAGSEEHERKSQYIKGLYGGIHRLGQARLADRGNQLAL